jgi:hypothetical protein
LKLSKKALSKVEKFIDRKAGSIKNVLLIKLDTDSYNLFEDYYISKQKNEWIATHISKLGARLHYSFNKLASATGWAIAHNAKQIQLAQKILHWDQQQQHFADEIQDFEFRISNSKDNGFRELLLAKKSRSVAKAVESERELNKYLNIAKYWQTKGFNNEIAGSCSKNKLKKYR